MGLPIILLFVFLGRAVSLPGAEDGIHKYIGIWDTSVLVERPDVWSRAVSQIFFSLSVTFGVMTAYGSHCKTSEPAFANSCVIACSNCLFSFISGFAVFASIGHLAYLSGTGEFPTYESFGLVFGTWPVVFNTLPGGVHWVRLLFFDLFLLGIDSAFAFFEAILTVVRDTVRFNDKPKYIVAGVGCVLAWLPGLIYCTDAGLLFLDVIDFYINFVMLFVGLLETFSVGWIYGLEKSIENLGAPVVFFFLFGNFGSVILASGLWFGLKNDHSIWAGFVALIVFYLACLAVCLVFMKKKGILNKDGLYELFFANMFDLKEKLEPVIGYVPSIWCILVRHLIPHILLILFINLARAHNDVGQSLFGHYGQFATWPYQVLGMLTAVFAFFLFLIGVAAPKTMAWLDLPPEKQKWKSGQSVEKAVEEDEEEAENAAEPESEKVVENAAEPESEEVAENAAEPESEKGCVTM
jgi:hypothetical protein